VLRTCHEQALLPRFLMHRGDVTTRARASPVLEFEPRYARPGVLDAKLPKNGKNPPFSGMRPKPPNSTPLLGIDFPKTGVLVKIDPRAALAFSVNSHRLGPSKMTIFGRFGGSSAVVIIRKTACAKGVDFPEKRLFGKIDA